MKLSKIKKAMPKSLMARFLILFSIALLVFLSIDLSIYFAKSKLTERNPSDCGSMPGGVDLFLENSKSDREKADELAKQVDGYVSAEYPWGDNKANYRISVPVGKEKKAIEHLESQPDVSFADKVKYLCHASDSRLRLE